MTEAAAKIEKKLGKLKRREGLTVLELLELVPDDDYAEAWLCWARWGEKVRCVDCGSENIGVSGHRQMRFRCRSCHDRADEICRPPDARQTPQMQRPHRRIAQKQAELRFSQKSQPAAPAAAGLAVCQSAAVADAAGTAAAIAVFRFTIAVFQDSLAGQSQNRHFSAQKA